MEKPRTGWSWIALVVPLLVGVGECETTSPEQQRVIELVNQSRAAAGLGAVAWHPDMSKRADAWAYHLATLGRLEHSDLTSWCYASNHGGHCEENVGAGPSIEAVHAAYMSSAPHRANILSPGCYHIGAGYYKAGATVYTVHQFECNP